MANERGNGPQQAQGKSQEDGGRIAALEAQIEELKKLVMAGAQQTSILSTQHANFTGLLEQEIAKNKAREAEFAELSKRLNRPSQARSQEQADERYPANERTKRYLVKVLGKPKHEDQYGRPLKDGPRLDNGFLPDLYINAMNPEGAIGSYQALCGIQIKEGAEVVAEEPKAGAGLNLPPQQSTSVAA